MRKRTIKKENSLDDKIERDKETKDHNCREKKYFDLYDGYLCSRATLDNVHYIDYMDVYY